MTLVNFVRQSETNASRAEFASRMLPRLQQDRLAFKKISRATETILPLNYGIRSPSQVTKRLRYASFVSNKHRIVYVETPKNACTPLKWILARIHDRDVPLVHYPLETSLEMCIHYRDHHPLPALTDFSESEVRKILKHYRLVCVVRNPFTRLVSAWANKIRLREPGYGEICRAIAQHAQLASGSEITFKNFAYWVVETNDSKTCNEHWRPQTNLLYPDVMGYTDALRVESLTSDLKKLFHAIPTLQGYCAASVLPNIYCNKSIPLNYQNLYDKELAIRVREFYASDFEAYGYDKSSWEELADKSKPSYEETESAALSVIRQRNTLIEHLGATAEKRLNSMSEELLRAQWHSQQLEKQLAAMSEELLRAQRHSQHREKQLAAIHSSTVWWLTAPLRLFGDKLGWASR